MEEMKRVLEDVFSGRKVYPGENIKRRSAVLIPIVFIDDAPQVLFEKRASKLDTQPGEICFPGGAVEKDETPKQAALRETCEELLVKPAQVKVVGACHIFSRLYNEYIRSYTGMIEDYNGTFSADEVDSVFTLPLSELLETEPEIHETKVTTVPMDDFPWELIPGGRDYRFYYAKKKFYFYKTEYGTIWGITAEFLYRFLEDIKKHSL